MVRTYFEMLLAHQLPSSFGDAAGLSSRENVEHSRTHLRSDVFSAHVRAESLLKFGGFGLARVRRVVASAPGV